MTRDLGRERVVAESAADSARGGMQGGGEGFVGGYAAGGDLCEEGVDALGRGGRLVSMVSDKGRRQGWYFLVFGDGHCVRRGWSAGREVLGVISGNPCWVS